jgi:cyclophilin family peptidyl-prolyl cis-trans isomerase
MKLRPDQAPNTSRHILELVEGGFYTDIVVHRIIPANANGDPFVIQFGDPRGFGLGGPGFYVDLEPSQLDHGFGVVSMARQGDNPDSNGSQLFIALSRAGTRHLDGNYTAFAEIIDGVETILALENVEIADIERGVPAEPKPVVESARAIPAPPIDEWPDRIRRPAPQGADQTR